MADAREWSCHVVHVRYVDLLLRSERITSARLAGEARRLLGTEYEPGVGGDDLPAPLTFHPHVRRAIAAIDVDAGGGYFEVFLVVGRRDRLSAGRGAAYRRDAQHARADDPRSKNRGAVGDLFSVTLISVFAPIQG